MFHGLSQMLPPEAAKLTLAFILAFLIGLEREEHKTGGGSSFGGVRTFPLIGCSGSRLPSSPRILSRR